MGLLCKSRWDEGRYVAHAQGSTGFPHSCTKRRLLLFSFQTYALCSSVCAAAIVPPLISSSLMKVKKTYNTSSLSVRTRANEGGRGRRGGALSVSG